MTLRLAHHVANVGIDTAGAALPSHVPGVDVSLAAANGVSMGADRDHFAHWLSVGLAAREEHAPDVGVVDILGISAWRAGALPLREDALSRVVRLVAGPRAHTDVVAATLGLAGPALEEFAVRQRSDRWWWPGRDAADGYALCTGGFAGIGGAWVTPADAAVAFPDAAAFAIRAGERWWRLDSDVWGSRLAPMNEVPQQWDTDSTLAPPATAAGLRPLATRREGAGATSIDATVIRMADSYLAWLHVEQS